MHSKIIQIIAIWTVLFLNTQASASGRHFPQGTHDVFIAKTSEVRSDLLKNITPVIDKSIAAGNYPGAVVLISHHGKIIYRGIFGNRRVVPSVAPMRLDTVFDIASLTKVVATTPAIMQLVEQNKIDLDASVARYWPQFTGHGKEKITVRELLTHTSGLPADVEPAKRGSQAMFQKIVQLKLIHQPGEKFVYSDINFIVLAHLVEIITHEKFNRYTQAHIFTPLNMSNTTFLPPEKWRDNIAPTDIENKKLRWGKVQDPLAQAMEGVSGNAGLFSTATDLDAYAQCLLNGGRLPSTQSNHYLLGPLTILKMVTPETPVGMLDVRGLGWDIDSAYSNRGILFPVRSFGHSGWTGTSIWIDPATETSIIILTSRTHPVAASHNQLIEDRRAIANIVSASITDVEFSKQANTSKAELSRAYPRASKEHRVV